MTHVLWPRCSPGLSDSHVALASVAEGLLWRSGPPCFSGHQLPSDPGDRLCNTIGWKNLLELAGVTSPSSPTLPFPLAYFTDLPTTPPLNHLPLTPLIACPTPHVPLTQTAHSLPNTPCLHIAPQPQKLLTALSSCDTEAVGCKFVRRSYVLVNTHTYSMHT